MKNYLKFLVLSVFGLMISVLSVHAQAPYMCVTKGATLDYASYDEADRLQSHTRLFIKDVSNPSEGNYTLRVENSTIKKPGQKKSGDDAYVSVVEVIQGHVVALPVTSDGTQTVIEGAEALLLPNKLAVGYKLPIGDVRLDMAGMATVASLTENEVIGREEVTTPAGTFKCYILKQTMSTSMLGMAMISTTKSWYSRGVGIVKRETTIGGRIVNHIELVNYSM